MTVGDGPVAGPSTEKAISRFPDAARSRSICLVGHVDHGKSSFADSLLAANGIISARLAGQIRYLDSREDEQERGITMESSAVSLNYRRIKPGGTEVEDYLVNLIDTPGHIDFSSEVSTASRLCDGVLVVVDAVEGVCTQTINVLRQAWIERLRPILVLNKLDRLIIELKLSPIEAHHHLVRLVEQVNAVMGGFFASERMDDDLRWRERREQRQAEAASMAGEDTAPDAAFEERDDEDLYFAPERGNVIFASALDGWAFRLDQFAHMHAVRLGMREDRLRLCLWGEFYYDAKSKRVVTKPGTRLLKPTFVQFVLDNLWAVYDCVTLTHNAEKISKVVAALGLKVRPADLKSKDTRNLLVSLMSGWLPLAPATFRAIVDRIPGPAAAQAVRLPRMLHPEMGPGVTIEPTNKLERDLYSASVTPDACAVAYVSKLFAVPTRDLPQHQRRALTADEMRQRGRERREAAAAAAAAGAAPVENGAAPLDQVVEPRTVTVEIEETMDENAETLIGFSRIYSGTIRAGQSVYVVLPKFNPTLPPAHPSNAKHLAVATVGNLFMLMGRELVAVDSVPAGNVFGLTGLEGKVPRNATLCAIGGREAAMDSADGDRECLVNLAGVSSAGAPIVRVALEPREPSEMSKLVEGLRLLNQADPCVETLVQETGEHVILTAGELHLERCLKDLRERFAKIKIQASPPIVPFRETAVSAPEMPPPKTADAPRGTIVTTLLNGAVSLTIRARPLPSEITAFLVSHSSTIKRLYATSSKLTTTANDELDAAIEQAGGGALAAAEAVLSADEFWSRLDTLFVAAGESWAGVADKIWSFGPKRLGSNMLVDSASSRSLRHRVEKRDGGETTESAISSRAFDESVYTAFQLATFRGPLCAEPMTGLAFFVERLEVSHEPVLQEQLRSKLSQLTGALISSGQEAFRSAMLDWSPRLLLAMYTCDIQASTDVLGKVYAVVSKRRGHIVAEEMREGTSFFTITALLPVVESFGFADDIRTRTSGAASPQLVFSGFQLLDQDPYWVPTTEEELEDLGDKADRENVARRYTDQVRTRKGMAVERKIVEKADKQRTRRRD